MNGLSSGLRVENNIGNCLIMELPGVGEHLTQTLSPSEGLKGEALELGIYGGL